MTTHVARPGRAFAIAACAVLFLVVVAVRLWYVDRFAMAIPFWDQWDSEGDLLLRPWLEGTLAWSQLWQPHNEHRVMLSRLLFLAVYEVTGSWDNLVAARLNTLLSALSGALLLWLLLRDGALRGARWLVLPVLLAGLVLPFGWENFLVGFQSQFYLMVLQVLAVVALAAHRPDNARAQVSILGLSVLACFTMASGILAAVAAGFVLWCHGRVTGSRSTRRNAVIVLLAAIALIGYGTTPKLAYHDPLKARGLFELVDAASHMLGWPVQGYHWAAPLLWAPGLLGVAWMLLRRKGGRSDLLMAGLLGWSFLQACAAAYSRGHDMIDPASRYLDLLVPGLVANAWFAARLLEQAWAARRPSLRAPATAAALVVAAAFATTFACGHVYRFDHDRALMAARKGLSIEQTRNVNRYVSTGDPAALDKPPLAIPYPHKDRLQSLLDDPGLRGALARGHALDDPDTGKPTLPPPPR